MNNNIFPYRAYAMEYGTFLGIAWTAVFLIYVAGFRTFNNFLFLIGFFGFMSLAILPFIFAWRIKQMQEYGQALGMLRSLSFSLNLFMFACIFSAVCEYAYFSFFDHGMLIEGFNKMMLTAETETVYKQMGMMDSYNQLKDMVNQITSMSAFEKTEMLFNSNLLVSMMLIIPVSILASLTPSGRGTDRQS